MLWIESQRAVIAGDTLVDFGPGFHIASWLREGVTRTQVAEGLSPLLERPVELVLPAHGAPTDRGRSSAHLPELRRDAAALSRRVRNSTDVRRTRYATEGLVGVK